MNTIKKTRFDNNSKHPSTNSFPLDTLKCRVGSEEDSIIKNEVSSSSYQIKVIKVIPESQSYEDCFQKNGGCLQINSQPSEGNSKSSKKFNQKLTEAQKFSEEKIVEDEEMETKSSTDDSSTTSEKSGGDEMKSLNMIHTLTSPESDTAPQIPPVKPLDKKELKKLDKFLEHMNDYMTKLEINDERVAEKFKDFASRIIPNIVADFKGKPFEAIAAAILLQSCRECDLPITLRQVVKVSEAKEKILNKCILTIKANYPVEHFTKQLNAGEMIEVIGNKLQADADVKEAAVQIWENIEKLNFIKSVHAATLGACCILVAGCLRLKGSDSNITVETVACAANISKLTLRTVYRALYPYRSYFITKDCKLQDPKNLKEFWEKRELRQKGVE